MKPEIELYSGPGELLTEHLERMLRIWKDVSPRFQATLPRLFEVSWDDKIDKTINRMLLLHDLGKATKNWQPEEPEKWVDNEPYLCPMCEPKHKPIKPQNQTPAQVLVDHVRSEHRGLEKTENRERGKWWRDRVKIDGKERELLVVDDLRQQKEEKRPPHAQLGGVYLWWAFCRDRSVSLAPTPDRSSCLPDDPERDLLMASAFAIAIHHTDEALARPGIEDPATLLVKSGLINEADDRVRWHEGLDGFVGWLRQKLGKLLDPSKIDVYDVSGFALALREWARGATLLELHKRRLQVAALHSVIKVCDIRAAIERSSEQVIPVNVFTWKIVNGGMIPWTR